MTPLDIKEIREAQEFLNARQALKRAQQQQEEPQRLICAWCRTVKREGSLPASHGICDACSEEVGGYIFGVIARVAAPPEPRRVRWLHLWPWW